MLTRIQRWLAPPVFEGDEDKTRSARVLNALLIILMVLLIFMVSIYVPFISVEKPFSLALVLVLIFALVVTRWQMQRGRVWLASVIWVCLMWIVVTVLLFFAGGMTSIAAVFYVAGTIIAGLLLGTRMASIHALACILAGLVMVILESIGRSLPRVFPLPPFAGWVGMIVSLSLAMIALNLVMRSLKGALELTRQQVEERRRAEEALRHREQEFKTLVENNPDMVARFDRAYRHTYVNPAVEKELGTPLESLLGKTHRELGMAPETADWSEDLIRQVFETGQEVTFELSMPTPSGVQHYLTRGVPEFAEDGTVASALFIHRNVTALKQAEEALRESEEKFSKAFQSSPLAVLITRLSDGQFIEVNQTFESFGGYRRDEVIGRTSLDLGLVNPEDRESAKRILQEHGSFKNSEARFYTKSGEERIGLFSGEVIEIGGEACIIQVVSDITERKQANEALRESEEQYRALVENSLLGVGISRGNQVIFANPALLRIFGYDNFEEFARVPLLDHVAPSSRELISERSKKMAQGEPMPVEFEYDIVRKDGEIRTLQASTSTVTLGDGNYRHTTFQDITKRKQTEEALRESEEKFSKAFQSSPLAVAITRMPDGQFIEVNQTFEVLSGYSRDEVIGLTSLDLGLINLEDREMGQRTLQELGSFRNLEIRFYTKSGEERIGLFSGELIEIGGEVRLMQVVSDITERVRTEEVRRQAEEALRESEERYRAMFDHMQSGVAVYQVIGDGDDFAFKDFNAAAERISRIPRDQVIGRRLLDKFPHMDRSGLFAALQRVARTGRAEYLPAFYYRDAQREGWRENFIYQLPTGDVVALYNDVTERARAEEALRESHRRLEETLAELKETQEQMLHQEHLAAVGQLAAGIAHDFNNILATIVLYTQMLLRTAELSPQIRQRLEIIAEQTDRAADLVQQILDFGRRSVLERRPLALDSLLKEVVKLLERTLPESIQIALALEPDLRRSEGPGEYLINADLARIQQALVNLALNARDAMPNGGELHVALSRVVDQEIQCVDCGPVMGGEWVQVTVTDTGKGIAPDVLPRIFEPFFTTRAPLGHGLGLSQVYGIVKQHGGHIDVQTQVGQGTTFRLYWPALATARPQVKGEARPEIAQGQGETILVVEDDATMRAALVDVLEMLGYRVLEAANGREALAVCEQHVDEIALVLSDWVMPSMGGLELVRELEARHWTPKVLMLTGHPLAEDVREAVPAHVVGWMLKPPSIEQLAEAVSQALAEGQE